MDIDTTATVCGERNSSVEKPSKIKNTVCLIESEKYGFLIVDILNPLAFLFDIYKPTNIPKLETRSIDDITGTILKISDICILNIKLINIIPKKLKRERETNDMKERRSIFLFLVDQYIATRDTESITKRSESSMFLSYILQFCDICCIKFIFLEIF